LTLFGEGKLVKGPAGGIGGSGLGHKSADVDVYIAR